MQYPADMTAEDIMEFEYEYNRYLEDELNEGRYISINAELRDIANEQLEKE